MSTILLRQPLSKARARDIKIFSVNTKSETLGDYVKRKRAELGLSILDIERRSRAGGAKGISNGYITQIENDPTINPSSEKLKALARGLGVPEHELLTVAGFKNVITPDSDPVLMEISGFFSGYENLDEEDKRELEPMLVMIANDIRRRVSEKIKRMKREK